MNRFLIQYSLQNNGFSEVLKENSSQKYIRIRNSFRCLASEGDGKESLFRGLVSEGTNLLPSCTLTTEYTGSLGKWVACEKSPRI